MDDSGGLRTFTMEVEGGVEAAAQKGLTAVACAKVVSRRIEVC